MSEWENKARFYARHTHLSLPQTFWRWIWSGFREWDRDPVDFIPVHPGDPRYDDAPYSAKTLYRNL